MSGVIPSSRTMFTPPMWADAHVSVIFWCRISAGTTTPKKRSDQTKQTSTDQELPFFCTPASIYFGTFQSFISDLSYHKKRWKNHYLCQYPCLTFHLLLQGETSMYLLQFCFHGQPADVRLQVCAVHHANAEHDERDVLRLGAHKAASPSTCTGRLAGCVGILLLILKYHFTERLRGVTSCLCGYEWLEGI